MQLSLLQKNVWISRGKEISDHSLLNMIFGGGRKNHYIPVMMIMSLLLGGCTDAASGNGDTQPDAAASVQAVSVNDVSAEADTVSEDTVLPEEEPAEEARDKTREWMDDMGIDPAASELDLSGTDLSGVNMGRLLKYLPELRKLTLLDCGLSNDDCARLQDENPGVKIIWEIVLSNWTVRTDAVAFSTMKSCDQEFFLDNSEAYYLRYCRDLVALDLGHNYVSDLSFLEYMPELKILILVDNVRGVVNGRLTHLTDLSELRYVPKLRYLEIFANNVSDFEFMEYLPELEDLNISYNSVSSIEHMQNLPKLERLWMEHTYISAADTAYLRQLYPNAKIVSVGEGSVDQGWRSGAHYNAMRRMFRENVVDEIYE